MSPQKISPIIPLAVGVLCIGAAVVGGVMVVLQEGEEEKKPKAKAAIQASARKPAPAPAPAPEKEPPSPEELRQQATRILLARIAETPTELNEEWLAQYLHYIRTEADLDAFFAEYLTLGQARSLKYDQAQKASRKLLPQDPRYFVGQATSALHAKKSTERSLFKDVRDNMAQALYKEQEEAEGMENVEEAFMGTFFKKLLRMYELLEEIEEAAGGKPDRWFEEHVRTLEAAVMDRYVRVQRRLQLAREKKEGTKQSIAGHLFRTDLLEKAVTENLLLLGKVYHRAAAKEVRNREKHRFYADQAFYVLAMIYQRAKSGEALNVMRQVNEIQRNYLYHLGRRSWKRAQLAVATNDSLKADEHFFTATRRYLQAMSQSVAGRRDSIAVEYAILKKEIARWKSRDRGAATTTATQL